MWNAIFNAIKHSIRKEQCSSILAHLNENGIVDQTQFSTKHEKYSLLTSTMTAVYDVVEHNLYAQSIQPF